jgi:hypothetical protein
MAGCWKWRRRSPGPGRRSEGTTDSTEDTDKTPVGLDGVRPHPLWTAVACCRFSPGLHGLHAGGSHHRGAEPQRGLIWKAGRPEEVGGRVGRGESEFYGLRPRATAFLRSPTFSMPHESDHRVAAPQREDWGGKVEFVWSGDKLLPSPFHVDGQMQPIRLVSGFDYRADISQWAGREAV